MGFKLKYTGYFVSDNWEINKVETESRQVESVDIAAILMETYGDLHPIWKKFKPLGIKHMGYDKDSEIVQIARKRNERNNK